MVVSSGGERETEASCATELRTEVSLAEGRGTEAMCGEEHLADVGASSGSRSPARTPVPSATSILTAIRCATLQTQALQTQTLQTQTSQASQIPALASEQAASLPSGKRE